MRKIGTATLVRAGFMLGAAALVACGGTQQDGPGFHPDAGSPGSSSDASGSHPVDGSSGPGHSDANIPIPHPGGNDAAPPPPPVPTGDGGVACPTGLQCNVSCSGGGTTTISGKVYDPAKKNPLYNAAVYVPATPLQALPKGVPSGNDSCSCGALFKSGALTNTVTDVDGTFTLQNVPVGTAVPLVIQIGKWRRALTVSVAACQDNPQADKSVAFLGTIPAGDTDDNIPDIAVSTGSADTLECLTSRIGIPNSEYVAGNSSAGHIHIFSGGNDSSSGTGNGRPETPAMSGAPNSYKGLWDTQADLMNYDIVLLSCEGGETFNAKPDILEQYLNAGGRAFGSHFHYAWFGGHSTGGFGGGGGGAATPAPPADWGANLASWFPGGAPIPGGSATVTQTLTGSTAPFAKGVALEKWLGIVNAVGIEGAASGLVPVFQEKGDVGAVKNAQAWLTDGTFTDYLSFDTPANAPAQPDGGAPAYCGRAVFSDLHVGGDNNFTQDSKGTAPPANCAAHDLSPQEKVLEFMLFDLSACVIPDTVAPPPADAGLPPPPQ